MFIGNKEEWSEIYTLFKLLEDSINTHKIRVFFF